MYTMLLRWLRWDSGSSHRSPDRRHRVGRRLSFVPSLLVLEDRTLLSTFVVSNLTDSGSDSLRQAVLDANAHRGTDTIRFADGVHGTITLTSGELNITDSLTIDGPGASRLTVSGNDASRVFTIAGSAIVVDIADLTIAHGRATGPTMGNLTLGGGLLNAGGVVTLSRVTFADNVAIAPASGDFALGGGLANTGAGSVLAVDHSSFTGNQANGFMTAGGGIANLFAASLTLTQTTFIDNHSAAAFFGTSGAIMSDAGAALTIEDSVFTGNQATATLGAGSDPRQGVGLAGVLLAAGGSRTVVSHSTFTGNLARGGNGEAGAAGGNGFVGAVENGSGSFVGTAGVGTMTVTDSTFADNEATGGAGGERGNGGNAIGGAMGNASTILTVAHCLFVGNHATGGAGGNGGNATGGAIDSYTSAFTPTLLPIIQITDAQFVGNQAVGGAGGLGGNGGNAFGGGLANLTGTMIIADGLLVQNQANGGLGSSGGNGLGGGIFTGGPSSAGPTELTIRSTTIVNSRADGGSAGDGGSPGQGRGGGVYISSDGAACADSQTTIIGNHASTGDEDVFGVLDKC